MATFIHAADAGGDHLWCAADDAAFHCDPPDLGSADADESARDHGSDDLRRRSWPSRDFPAPPPLDVAPCCLAAAAEVEFAAAAASLADGEQTRGSRLGFFVGVGIAVVAAPFAIWLIPSLFSVS